MPRAFADTITSVFTQEIQWPGYNPGYGTQQPIQISVDITRTTRAMIAQIIAQKVVQFMTVSATYSADCEQLFISCLIF